EAEDVDIARGGDVAAHLNPGGAVGVAEQVEPGGGGERLVAGGGLEGVGAAGAVEGLEARDVLGGQGGDARAEVVLVDGRGGVGTVVEAEGVGRFVQHGSEQVDAVGAADAVLIRRVELDIARPGAGGRLVGAGGGQLVHRLRVGGQADIAEARVALGPA